MNDGNEYETGGSVIHQRNKYMSDFVKNFGELSHMHVFQTVIHIISIRSSKTYVSISK